MTDGKELSILYEDKRIASEVVAGLVPLSKFLNKSEGTVFCPFHADYNHKSAKIYKDEDDVSRLFCFGQCRRQYTSYHYIQKVLKQNPVYYLLRNVNISLVLMAIQKHQVGLSVVNEKEEFVKEKFKLYNYSPARFIDAVYGQEEVK